MKLNLPVILLKGTVLLPESEVKFEFEDDLSKSIIDESEMFHNNKILVVTKLSVDENIIISELPKIATIASILRKLELPNGKIRVVLKGISRAKIIEYLTPTKDSIESIVDTLSSEYLQEDIKVGVVRKLYAELDEYIKKVPYMSNSLLAHIDGVKDLDKITDIIVNNLPIDNFRKLEYVLECSSLKRSEMILEDIYKEEQLFNIEKSIDVKVKRELDKDQKDLYLKEKIKLLKTELGELSPLEKEVEQLKIRVAKLNINDTIKDKILYEISRYENTSSLSPELSSIRNYIEFMINLPWNNFTTDIDDLNFVRNNLNATHYGLEEVKSRVIEYLAIKKQSNSVDTPIICLVGPPGVGKTTFAHSIAKSMGRNFVKISLGGVDDEAIIKGHIRTYIGACPGKIMDGISRAKSSNPVFLIDEIDKMSSNYKGDPQSALLDVLDSTQNKYFKDNYVDEEYDLSNVLFIATANSISDIPDALKDRFEIININGYTEFEKIEIARRHLIPTICEKHGIKNIKISDNDLKEIIRHYTKESGLRDLERMISKIVRKIVAEKIIDNKKTNLNIKNIPKYLGKKIYETDTITNEVGVVNGLAYTSYGGDVLKIESNCYEGNGNIILTGSMGEVMLESAKIALSYIKSNYNYFGINKDILKNDIHINVPNISVKKDGPSAGVAIVTCIISTLSNMVISNKIAFTGEITLRGNILSVGGLKEKIIGAYINNIETIFIPYSNLSDLDDVPLEIKNKIRFIPVRKYEDVYNTLKMEEIV